MYTSIYTREEPILLKQLADTPEMRRLSDVGMHCGCEYAHFPVYQKSSPYSRLMHSIGVANIVWHFTQDMRQAVAGLFHDIATPVFAHTIDFMNNDHMTQESTEDKTLLFIKNSKDITALLNDNHICIDDVSDYHQYPIADNDTPMLSADRLEYTLGNALLVYGIATQEIQAIYNDITVTKNENGIHELAFKSIEAAGKFTEISLRNSYLFVSDEDRFTMQFLADLVRNAIDINCLSLDDLYTTEKKVIHKLMHHPELSAIWANYTKLSHISTSDVKEAEGYCINISAKKRYINPLVVFENSTRRITEIDIGIHDKVQSFLALDFNKWICAK